MGAVVKEPEPGPMAVVNDPDGPSAPIPAVRDPDPAYRVGVEFNGGGELMRCIDPSPATRGRALSAGPAPRTVARCGL